MGGRDRLIAWKLKKDVAIVERKIDWLMFVAFDLFWQIKDFFLYERTLKQNVIRTKLMRLTVNDTLNHLEIRDFWRWLKVRTNKIAKFFL